MGALKEFYFEEICKGIAESQNAEDFDFQYQEVEEDAQIIMRVEEMKHSEMPNFLR